MPKYINDIPAAPKAIGPYSQAAEAGGLIFISGQIPLEPASGQLAGPGIAEQTEQVMKNLAAILSGIELGFSQVVKSTIYLTDLANFQLVNEIYARWMGESRPARATLQVAALPRGAQVEIEMIAARAG